MKNSQMLKPREELLHLQKQIYKANKKIIEESVIHQDKSFLSYEKAYHRRVKNYKKISDHDEMLEAALKANIVYIGDYHTLKQSQKSILKFLKSLQNKNKNFAVVLEMIQIRHQDELNRFLKGKLSESTFLKRIGSHWFFDLWQNFKPLFDFAKENEIKLYGLEADPESSLLERDQSWAKRIVDLFWEDSQRLLVVVAGDLHLAPNHLPKKVEMASQSHGKIPKTITLYQNSDSIYWKLAENELEADVHIVRISKNEFCRMHTPPIICQQSYLNWLEHEEGELDFADAKYTFLQYMNQIADFLGVSLDEKQKDDIEVFTCGDLSFLKRLRESKVFSHYEIDEIKRQILRSESYTIPKLKFVYLANVSVNHAAEEASHMVRVLCAGQEFPRAMQDAFYANVLHEAMGFFGSKVINHKRKCPRPQDFKNMVALFEKSSALKDRGLEYMIAKLFIDHEKNAKTGKAIHPNRIKALSVDLFLGLTHALGYYLGEKMFYGLLSDKLEKSDMVRLFNDAMEEDGEPVIRYFEYCNRLKKVKLPIKL